MPARFFIGVVIVVMGVIVVTNVDADDGRERDNAIRARDRLVVLLNSGRPVELHRTGVDRYGRTLARFDGIGEQLIREGLASRWPQRRNWCR